MLRPPSIAHPMSECPMKMYKPTACFVWSELSELMEMRHLSETPRNQRNQKKQDKRDTDSRPTRMENHSRTFHPYHAENVFDKKGKGGGRGRVKNPGKFFHRS